MSSGGKMIGSGRKPVIDKNKTVAKSENQLSKSYLIK